MDATEQRLRARGCPTIRLMIRADNLAANEFYAVIGYEIQDVVTIAKRL